MKKPLILLLFSTLILSACAGISPWRNAPSMPMHPQDNWRTGDRYQSNGERIYYTGSNDQGERILYSRGPAFGGGMMGSSLSCASCHGDDGRGGTHFMHMQVMEAPDIRYEALRGEAEEHSNRGDGEDHHDDEHSDYDLADFRRAVIEGVHPDGEPLSGDMPRWQMGDQDLADLFEFIKSLQN